MHLEAQERSFLSEEHSQLLEWYFGEGGATFGRSTCGAIIEKLETFAFGSEPCTACNGTGFRGGWSYGDTPTPKKQSERDELLALIVEQQKDVKKHSEADACCGVCFGMGTVPRTSQRRARGSITAQPKALGSEGAGYTPTIFALQNYAIACRRLEMVNRFDQRAANVLEAFFGDWGGRWANTNEGRLFAVYSLTAAGHKLIRMSKKKAALENYELPPHEVLGVEFELQISQPNNTRRDLFTAARDQAKRLLERASRIWNASEPPRERWKREQKEAKRKATRDARIREILDGAEAAEAEGNAEWCLSFTWEAEPANAEMSA